jgi:hypothetical protein
VFAHILAHDHPEAQLRSAMERDRQPSQLWVNPERRRSAFWALRYGTQQRFRGDDGAHPKNRLILGFQRLGNWGLQQERQPDARMAGLQLRACPLLKLRGMMRNNTSNERCRSLWVMHTLQQITNRLFDSLVIYACPGFRQIEPC